MALVRATDETSRRRGGGDNFTTEDLVVSFGSGGGGADRNTVVADAHSLITIRRLQSWQAGGSVAALPDGKR
jgi:hypothetical protein